MKNVTDLSIRSSYREGSNYVNFEFSFSYEDIPREKQNWLLTNVFVDLDQSLRFETVSYSIQNGKSRIEARTTKKDLTAYKKNGGRPRIDNAEIRFCQTFFESEKKRDSNEETFRAWTDTHHALGSVRRSSLDSEVNKIPSGKSTDDFC